MKPSLPRPSGLPALLALVVLAGCKDATAPARPGTLAVHGTVAATATVGRAITPAPAVRVLDDKGRPMAGVPVSFAVTAGGGSVSTPEVRTSADGTASVAWTLGTRAVANELTARVDNLPPLLLAVTATADVPASASLHAGATQTASVGNPLPVAPAVLVVDAFQNPVPNVPVSFRVTAGSGSIGGGDAVTNAEGIATVGSWTLGVVAGENTLSAVVSGLPPIAITATGIPRAPNALVIIDALPVALRSGVRITGDVAVKLVDNFGNTVPQSSVAVRAVVTPTAGRLSTTLIATGSDGIARFDGAALSGPVGTYTVRFEANGLVSAQTPAIALSAGPAHAIALITAPPSNVTNGVAFSTQPVVELRDDAGNIAVDANTTVTARIAAGSGALTGTTTAQATQGRAAFTNLGYQGNGSFKIAFAANGLLEAQSDVVSVAGSDPCTGPGAITLNMAPGDLLRTRADAADALQCISFDPVRNAGQEYLLLFENMAQTGTYGSAVFPGTPGNSAFSVTLSANGVVSGNVAMMSASQIQSAMKPAHTWDFGAGEIREL